jgi:hypothetical protein
MTALFRLLILLVVSHYRKCNRRPVVRSNGKRNFWRYEFLWWDEGVKNDGSHYCRPPWWRPFNAFLHYWNPQDGSPEEMHDHPRWSVTVCLRGKIIEETPWWTRTLTPGSVVIRSRKAIHRFSVPDGYRGKTWTLFIVGRRNHRQSYYTVTPYGAVR